MRRFIRVTPLLLVAITIMASIAAAPAQLATPDAPTAEATTNSGEMTISWNPVPGAQYYTVGWVNWTDAKPISDAGEDWLSQFHYTTVLGSETSYTVKGLDGGDDHYAIIRATDVEGAAAGRFGGGWSMFSSWSLPIQPTVQPAADSTETPAQPTTDGTSFLSISASNTCQQPVQRLNKGESCRWSYLIIHVVSSGEFDGWLFTRSDQDFVGLHNTGYYQIGDEVSGDLEIEKEGSVWVLKQVDHVAEQPPSEGAAIPGRPTASAECYVGQRLTPGQSCWFQLTANDDVSIFAVTSGGPYDGWAQIWRDDWFRFFQKPISQSRTADGTRHTFKMEKQGSDWVIVQYGPD